MTEKQKQVSGFVDFTAGSVGGVLQVISGHPLDTLKVTLLNNTTFRQSRRCEDADFFSQKKKIKLVTGEQTGGIVTIAKDIFRTEGISGLYKGVASPLVGLVAINAVLFTANGIASRFLVPANPDKVLFPPSLPPPLHIHT